VATRLMDITRRANTAVEQATGKRWNIAHVLVGLAIFGLAGVYGLALAEGFSFTYLLIGPIALVGLWMIFMIPEYAALALCGLRWGFIFDSFDRALKIQSPAIPLAALLLIVILALRFGPAKRKLVADPIAWLLVLYFGWVCLGLWYTEYPRVVEVRISDFAKDVLISLVIMNLITAPAVFERTLWLMIGITAVFSTLTIYQEVTQTYDNTYWDLAKVKIAIIVEGLADRPRAAGPLGDPNFYGQILLMGLPLAMWLIFNARTNFGRFAGVYTVIATLAAIGITYSRGTLLALGVVVLAYFFFFGFSARHLLFIIPVMIAAVMFAPPELTARLSTLSAFAGDGGATMADNSFQRRTVEVTMAFNMFLDHPIIGIGADNYRPYYPIYIREYGSPVESVERNAHSYYLEVAAEHGLIGLGLVFGMIWLSIKRIRQAHRDFLAIGNMRWANMATYYLIGCIGYLTTAVILHGDYPRLLWIQMAMSVAIGQAGKIALAEHEAAEKLAAPPVVQAPGQPMGVAAT
jgi:putative inorganic carbon (HCO3(-)) transporter